MYVLFILAYVSIGYIEYLFNITAAGAVDREFVDIVFPSPLPCPQWVPMGPPWVLPWVSMGSHGRRMGAMGLPWNAMGAPWAPHGHPYAPHGLLSDPKLLELYVLRARNRYFC